MKKVIAVVLFVLVSVGAYAQQNTVRHPSGFGVSAPVWSMGQENSVTGSQQERETHPQRGFVINRQHPAPSVDILLQQEALPPVGVTLGASFAGTPFNGGVPSDDNLAVGPNHIVQTVNTEFSVYNKTGTKLSGPTKFIKLFISLKSSSQCATLATDPVVLYDRAADRWLIAEIGFNSAQTSYSECVAVSKTNDPTGAYFLWAFNSGALDYDKASVWATASNSAYLFSNIVGFQNVGSSLCGFDRTKALAGNSAAAMLCQGTPVSDFVWYLPGDMDGPTPPVDGTPGLFLAWNISTNNQFELRKLTFNFTSGTSSLSNPTIITVPAFNGACAFPSDCVPQSGVKGKLTALGDRLMYRFAIRHFADHDRAVVNHSVYSQGTQVGIRWYEFYDPTGSFTLNQSGTYSPDTTNYRWMASGAEDKNADLALGYSISSSTIFPSIAITGRVPGDPAGTLESEQVIVSGAAASTTDRWGDYTLMSVDPTDDCTFWYTNQYLTIKGRAWVTNISSFKFTGCS